MTSLIESNCSAAETDLDDAARRPHPGHPLRDYQYATPPGYISFSQKTSKNSPRGRHPRLCRCRCSPLLLKEAFLMVLPQCRNPTVAWCFALFGVALIAGCGTSGSPPAPAWQGEKPGKATNAGATDQELTTDAGASNSVSIADQENWDVFYLGDSRIGYGVTKRRPAPGDAKLFEIEAVIKLKIRRYGEETETAMQYSTVETPDGKLRQARGALEAGGSAMKFEGTVTGDALQTTTSAGGNTIKGSIPWTAECRGFFAIEESLRKRPMQPGERRALRMLMPVFNQLVDVELTASKLETTRLLDGSQKDLLRVESVTTLADGQQNVDTFWTDVQGQTLKALNTAMQQSVYRTTREIALQKQQGAIIDIGQLTLVKTPRPIDNPHRQKQLRYRVHLAEGDPAKVFASDVSQRITSVGANTADILVRGVRPDDPPKGETITSAAPPNDDDRQPNSYIQSDDPRIVRMAREAAGDETNPWRTALALERYVNQKITKKNFSQTFATAADVAQSLAGDCTEHAVLLAALARARGIPSRVALGLVYVPSEQAFGFHMWTEVFVDDRWIGVDGTLGQGGLGAGHLKLSSTNLKDGAALASFLPVAQVMGRLKIEEITDK